MFIKGIYAGTGKMGKSHSRVFGSVARRLVAWEGKEACGGSGSIAKNGGSIKKQQR